ncbi:hypothetical protein [Flavobacterium sp. PL002]|uniref:hypothetical protein n=1 Tax=Flavobacterium sp. PL002 TaxID=1897058 RepID=UPI0017880CBB|nr:hypothetical protein [Flavobacterium sp. PL002]MBE0393888.1 hypothetical protein [Flavobacterium sp. PL002]
MSFILEYPKKKKYLKSSIGFLISNSILEGVFLSTYSFKESEELFNILTKKYGKPNVINVANADWPYSGYYWKGTKDGFDILLAQSMEKLNIEGENISGYTTEVYFVKQDLKIGKMETRETVLENFIKAHKQ